MIHGKNLILSDSQTGFGHFAIAKSCDVTTDADFLEVSSPTQGAWREYIQKQQSWSASTSHLLASFSAYKYFRSCQDNGTKLTIRFFDPEMQIFYRGYAYIKSLKLQGEVSSLAKMSVDLQTTGALEAAETVSIEELPAQSTMLQRFLVWNSQSSSVSIEDPVEYGEQDSVLYKEIDVSTKARTRFWIRDGRMLIDQTGDQTATILDDYDSTTLNAKTIIPLHGGERTVILGPGKYTILVNYQTQDGHEEGTYMSSF